MRGQLLLRGLPLAAVAGDVSELLDVLWVIVLEDVVLPPGESRAEVGRRLAGEWDMSAVLEESFGMSPADIAASERMYALAGGPAPIIKRPQAEQ